jgi:hypothetical protein
MIFTSLSGGPERHATGSVGLHKLVLYKIAPHDDQQQAALVVTKADSTEQVAMLVTVKDMQDLAAFVKRALAAFKAGETLT